MLPMTCSTICVSCAPGRDPANSSHALQEVGRSGCEVPAAWMGSVTSMVGPRPADQVRMARDVATMFDELRALADRQAELQADRARLQADVDRLAAELEQARWPWWQRLMGLKR